MSSEAQRNVEAFTRWLKEVVANRNRAAEIGFISPTFTMHSDAGEPRVSRDEWPNWVERNRPSDWPDRARRNRFPRSRRTLFTIAETDPQTGRTILKHSISILRIAGGQFAEAWIASGRRSADRGRTSPRTAPDRL